MIISIDKITVSVNNNKRVILADGISTLAHGHRDEVILQGVSTKIPETTVKK